MSSSKFVKGAVVTDGAGAGFVDVSTVGYNLRRVRARSLDLTGGAVVTAKDNAGAGGTQSTLTTSPDTTQSSGPMRVTGLTSPLRVAVTAGGASKRFRYEVELHETGP